MRFFIDVRARQGVVSVQSKPSKPRQTKIMIPKIEVLKVRENLELRKVDHGNEQYFDVIQNATSEVEGEVLYEGVDRRKASRIFKTAKTSKPLLGRP